MLKRGVVLGLVVALAFAVNPVTAGPKKPKPYTSKEGSIAAPHPVVYGNTGSVNNVVAKELEATCSLPQSNGLDAYVFAVPKAYQKRLATVTATGKSAGAAGYDLDIFTYDKNCVVNGSSLAEGTDEFGSIPKGTAWVLVMNYVGDPMTSVKIQIKP